jgi:hypothetical protein
MEQGSGFRHYNRVLLREIQQLVKRANALPLSCAALIDRNDV